MMATRPSTVFRISVFTLVAFLFGAAGVYFATLQNVWIDESTQLSGSTLDILTLFNWLGGMPVPEFGVPPDRMPPISYLIDAICWRIFGNNPLAFRFLHLTIALAGVLMLTCMMMRRFGLRAALATGLFLALSPKLIDTAVEIRAYPIFFTITCAQILFFFKLYGREKSLISYVGFVVLGFCSGYTHFFGVIATSAFFAALFFGARDRRDAMLTAVSYCFMLVLWTGLIPFIAGATEISGGNEQSAVDVAGLVLYIIRLIGHSSHMLSAPAAALYLGGAGLLIGLSGARIACAALKDGWAARPDPVLGLVIALAAGLSVTIMAAFVVKGFSPLKVSYNIWMLPLLAVLIGVATTSKDNEHKFLTWIKVASVSLCLVGALWGQFLFLSHAEWFVHGPERALNNQIADAGPGTAIVYEGEAWGYGFFPLYWRHRETLSQWSMSADGKEIRKIDRGGAISSNVFPVAALDKYRHLVIVRIETRTYRDLASLLKFSSPSPVPLQALDAFSSDRWNSQPTIDAPGIYWLTVARLDRRDDR